MKKFLVALGLLFATPVFAADNAVIITPGVGVTTRSKDIGALVQLPGVFLSDQTGAFPGAFTNFGTTPGAVLVPGVNASIFAPSGSIASGSVASGAIASGAYAAGSVAAGAGVDGWDLTQGAKADAVCGTPTGTCSIVALQKFIASAVAGALPAGSNLIGSVGNNVAGTNTQQIGCGAKAIYDATTNGLTQLVAASGSTIVYVCGYSLGVGGTATNVQLKSGDTGGACANSVAMTPLWQITTNAGIVDGSPIYRGLATPAGKALCIFTSAGNAVQGIVYYTQF